MSVCRPRPRDYLDKAGQDQHPRLWALLGGWAEDIPPSHSRYFHVQQENNRLDDLHNLRALQVTGCPSDNLDVLLLLQYSASPFRKRV